MTRRFICTHCGKGFEEVTHVGTAVRSTYPSTGRWVLNAHGDNASRPQILVRVLNRARSQNPLIGRDTCNTILSSLQGSCNGGPGSLWSPRQRPRNPGCYYMPPRRSLVTIKELLIYEAKASTTLLTAQTVPGASDQRIKTFDTSTSSEKERYKTRL